LTKYGLLAVDPDARVTGHWVFIETNNTGYEGVLERWWFSTFSKKGEPIGFFADMIPGLIGERETTGVDIGI
jgi:hypothetical protein